MITRSIRYEIDPFKTSAFAEYARAWGQAIPRNGADLIGDYAPHGGSSTVAYGVYNIESLAEYEEYRASLRETFRPAPTVSSPERSSSPAVKTASSCARYRRRTRR